MDDTALAAGVVTLIAGAIGWVLGRGRREPSRTAPAPVAPAPGPSRWTEAAAETPDRSACLALFDVDNLKGVNAQTDFDTGDRLLNAISDVMHRALPPGAGLERLESGRFLLWLPEVDLDEAAQVTETLRALGSGALVEGPGGRIVRTISAGIVATFPDESRSRAILRADVAVARAKHIGGNRTEVVRALPLPSLTPPRSEIEAAIADRALEYHVQPIFELCGRRPVGVEALLRWNRPDGEVLGPNGFMDTLDRIPEAGVDFFPDLAVEAALPFLDTPDRLYTTFNITGAVLDGIGSSGCRWLTQLLDRLPAESLVLEIVESAVVVNPDRAFDLISRLRDRGVRIALDDFGTGLSNLERLRRFPIDILNVDRTFIDGLGGSGREEAILTSLVSLAEGLGIDIIAEGIETETQAKRIANLGIHYGQGFHLGRPGPAREWAERFAAAGCSARADAATSGDAS